jgi:hypothetical protein
MPKTKSPNARPQPHPETSVSPKQLAANRANAQKSTGPRTPEGRARSARNAVQHGFTGSTFAAVRLEDIHEIGRLKADAVACYRPVNAQEMYAVERIALAQFKIFRGYRLEAGLFTAALDDVLDPNGLPWRPLTAEMVEGNFPVTRVQNRNFACATGLRKMVERSRDPLALLLRYQAQAEREYRRALEDFERLKALREQMPNEPIWQEEIEENHELATLEELKVTLPDGVVYDPGAGPDPDEPFPFSVEQTSRVPSPVLSGREGSKPDEQ